METKAGNLEGLAESSSRSLGSETKSQVAPDGFKEAPEDVPDPEEDDLDDLDDMLDEFSAPKDGPPPQASKSASSAKSAAPPSSSLDSLEDGLTEEEFVKQFEAGMAELMGELDSSPEMKVQFENMMKELGESGPASNKPPPSQTAATSSKAESSRSGEESFQDTIKKTMERMQSSSQQASDAAVADDTDDILAELMKQMQAGEGNEEDFSKMLLGMMEQLTNKDILYEPMKELHDKFPSWMENNEAAISKDERKRYKEQQTIVAEIVAKFEEKTYTDTNVADREYIVERMQKMQAAGSPPPDLVGDMATAQEAFSAPEEGCPQQ